MLLAAVFRGNQIVRSFKQAYHIAWTIHGRCSMDMLWMVVPHAFQGRVITQMKQMMRMRKEKMVVFSIAQ
jgi:hypothetical protein